MNTSSTSTRVGPADDRRPSTAVIDLLARVEGVDPLDLEPLYSAIDPDALDALCQSGSGFDSIEFTYGDHAVTVAATDGELEITIDRGPSPVGDPSGCGAADTSSL
ncbi:HalOD1 output domain-containing protein [Halosolutus amylolyticus]|uniref:HalOD1 output domain-containing protein n=1 Tax=Halosolutus amylolyticus TaxID=2932267 RepID=A0ABD5PRY6_9EURY|nr:HalOD1 output domain-containing protein [Halosolutus amylolyticus]